MGGRLVFSSFSSDLLPETAYGHSKRKVGARGGQAGRLLCPSLSLRKSAFHSTQLCPQASTQPCSCLFPGCPVYNSNLRVPTCGRREYRGVVNSGGTIWIQISALPLSSWMTPCQFTPICLTYFICRMGRIMVPTFGIILINVINRLNVLRLQSAGSGLS